jgi:hypothetical protein
MNLRVPYRLIKRPVQAGRSAASERKKYALVKYGDSGSLCEASPNAAFVQKIFHITE